MSWAPGVRDFHERLDCLDNHDLFPLTDMTAKHLAEAEEAMRAARREIAFCAELNRAVLADANVG